MRALKVFGFGSLFFTYVKSTISFYRLIYTANRTQTAAHFLFPLFVAMLKPI